jgi:tetratricopeptide (TPR) repeat protein
LDAAFSGGDLEALRREIGDLGDFPNVAPDAAIGMPLVYAIYHSPLSLVRELLDAGADPNSDSGDRFPPLIAALTSATPTPGATVRHDLRELVELLLTSLLDQLPDDASLAVASLDASGRSVVVSVDTTTWDPVTRQIVLDLDIEATTDRITSVVDVSLSAADERTATEWYVFADEIESSDPLAAEEAYRRSIQINDTFADAHLNLGRLLHADGKVREALDEYRAARTIDGEDAVTHYNIGVASQDLGDFEDAVAAYERAIELAPRFADARYNLSTLYEELGDTALAVQHLHAYRDLINGE